MELTASSTTPKRSDNCTKDDVLILARLVLENREVLKGIFTQNLWTADK